MTDQVDSKMETTELAQAVAALLDGVDPCPMFGSKLVEFNYKLVLEKDPNCSLLAFECLQALDDKSYRYEAFKNTGEKSIRFYGDPLGNIVFSGKGETTAEAIFAAVLDWWSKQGDK